MLLRLSTLVGLASLLLSLASVAHAISDHELIKPDQMQFSMGVGFEFESGDYGTDETVDTWRIPLMIEWYPHERFTLAAEIPYVHQSHTGETVLLGSTPVPMRQGKGGSRDASPGKTTATTVEANESESGLGDITLEARCALLREEGQTPSVLALLHAKLPTGDEEKGLGTGEFDWGGGIGIGRKFGNWSAYAEALYIKPGTSDRYDPDAYWDWLAALTYRTAGLLFPGVSLSGGTAPFDDADDPLEVKFRLGVLTGETTSLNLYVARGLSDGSPEWAAGLLGYFDF